MLKVEMKHQLAAAMSRLRREPLQEVLTQTEYWLRHLGATTDCVEWITPMQFATTCSRGLHRASRPFDGRYPCLNSELLRRIASHESSVCPTLVVSI